MLLTAIDALSKRLLRDVGLSLLIARPSSKTSSFRQILSDAISALENEKQKQQIILDKNKSSALYNNSSFLDITVHVCDLGPADTSMRYNPYSLLLPSNNSVNNNQVPWNSLKPWTCHLREEPWNDLFLNNQRSRDGTFESYTDYQKAYEEKNVISPLKKPPSQWNVESEADDVMLDWTQAVQTVAEDENQSLTFQVPTEEEIFSMLRIKTPEKFSNSIKSSKKNIHHCQEKEYQEYLRSTKNTGLFGTHWGGFHQSCVTETDALKCLNLYSRVCHFDDDAFLIHDWYTSKLIRNEKSLEHATFQWMSRSNDDKNVMNSNNLMEGEAIVRYMTAPLLLGCISPRTLWHAGREGAYGAEEGNPLAFLNLRLRATDKNPLRELCEGREWYCLLAAKHLAKEKKSMNGKLELREDSNIGMEYRYWRWQGFLCRYGISQLNQSTSADSSSGDSPKILSSLSSEKKSDGEEQHLHHRQFNDKNEKAIILIHEFGSVASRWSPTLSALSSILLSSSPPFNTANNQQPSATTTKLVAFTPDLIGFGDSEKPSISYTQYMWEAYSSSFAREIVGRRDNGRGGYLIGGIGMGGYTALGCAANDDIEEEVVTDASMMQQKQLSKVTASGSKGRGQCEGLILIDSAGLVLTKEEKKNHKSLTVAEMTATETIPPCRPPPKPLTSILTQGIVSYLRPQIKDLWNNFYPTNKNDSTAAVSSYTEEQNEFRFDDPGSLATLISSTKLPPFRSINELLLITDTNQRPSLSSTGTLLCGGEFLGPVLMINQRLEKRDIVQTPDANEEAFFVIMRKKRGDTKPVKVLRNGITTVQKDRKSVAKIIFEWMMKEDIIFTDDGNEKQRDIPVGMTGKVLKLEAAWRTE
mmetsp:Transcript_13566/g.15547  ORF Transcript_13566/g.15547 Transcript_13566/m.15547 type:complete len:868 (+) Transcript_13566:1235-3838(+)|eukprot:CAMPEP_0194365834 /NCGR_PEP_ID=MMETSP0174-20130528/13824_1 /TAXON_ID=216777 /ORGANISM="Proboscia alata, Strain PI-D3" /LENGTH=867 /DNA_ID=CAMNT_0039140677 /DNA_START=2438 /DNA_END=5041 /DNA_ORIENTATION=-